MLVLFRNLSYTVCVVTVSNPHGGAKAPYHRLGLDHTALVSTPKNTVVPTHLNLRKLSATYSISIYYTVIPFMVKSTLVGTLPINYRVKKGYLALSRCNSIDLVTKG